MKTFGQQRLIDEKQHLEKKLEEKEKQLCEQKEKYRTLVENAIAGIGITDLKENLTFVNETFAHMLGYSKEELCGVNLAALTDRNTFQYLQKETGKRLSYQNSIYEITLFKKEGSPQYVRVHCSPYEDEHGNITGTIGVVVDITERINAEQKIKQSEIFNWEIINNVGEGIVVYDKNLRYRLWNPYMEKITGKSAQEVLGKKAFEVFPHLKKYGLDKLMNEALQGRQVRTPDVPFKVPNTNKSGWSSGLYSPHYDEKGNIIGIIGNIHEITERKINEEKLYHLNFTKNRLFSIIGHDLKNPISEILGFAELLIRNSSTYSRNKVNQMHTYIHQSTKAVYYLLENLLEWSQLQSGEKNFHPENTCLKKLVDECMEIFKLKARQKEVKMDNHIPESLMAYVDRQMFLTVIRNLLSNALKYTPQHGKIWINSHPYGNKALLEISDNGIGMSSAQQKELFGLSETVSKKGISGEKGTGMGLNISRELIERSGEKIWVESELGEGASFYFTVPVI